MSDPEITFQVREFPEAGAIGYSNFTEADDWEHLKNMMRDAALCRFDEGQAPRSIRVHLVQDEVIPV